MLDFRSLGGIRFRLLHFNFPFDVLALEEFCDFLLQVVLFAFECGVLLVRAVRIYEIDLRNIAIAIEFTELAGFIPHDADGFVSL